MMKIAVGRKKKCFGLEREVYIRAADFAAAQGDCLIDLRGKSAQRCWGLSRKYPTKQSKTSSPSRGMSLTKPLSVTASSERFS